MKQTRRQFLKRTGFILSASATATVTGCFENTSAKTPGKKPNFVFFLVDDLGWADLGCYGSKFHETPNIDKLAANAMRFTDAYAACPVCSPTRASIMTGKYPTDVGITDWIKGGGGRNHKLIAPEDIHNMPLEEVTFPEVLKENGYTTFFAGKWHLGETEQYWPEHQGFDINIGGHHKGSPPGGYFAPYKNPRMTDGPDGEYLTDRLAEESVKFLDTKSDAPFLLYLSFYSVHTPIQAKKEHIEKYQAKLDANPPAEGEEYINERKAFAKQKQNNPKYAGMVESVDNAVGSVLDKLKGLGIDDNTIVMFMSDNGGLSTLPRKGGPTSNLPLRAGKGWCYEGGIREPMIIKWPGVTNPGTTCSVPVISNDFYPTILDMAGLKKMPDQHRGGISLAPVLKGGKSLDRKAIFWHYPHYHGSGHTPSAAVRAGDYKLIEFFEEKKIELYNLKEDIGEQNDLSKKMPKKVKELTRFMKAWRTQTNAQMPIPNPNYKKKS